MINVFEYLSTSTAVATNIVGIFGIPYGIYNYIKIKRKEVLDREDLIYNELDDKYFEFLRINIEYQKLKIDASASESNSLSEIEKSQQENLFFMLVSMLERAFILYQGNKSKERVSQKVGWYAYMNDFCKNETFQKLWMAAGTQFDHKFMQHMDEAIKNSISKPTLKTVETKL